MKDGGHVSVVHCPEGLENQYEKAAQHVQTAIRSGVPLHEIAVLCPTNAQCSAVAEVLRANDIPVSVRESAYRITAVTTLLEGCAAWSTLGRELSNYRLDDLLRRWRSVLNDLWTLARSVELTTVLMQYREFANRPASDLLDDVLDAGLRKALEQGARADEVGEFNRMHAALTHGELKGMTVVELAQRARKVDRVEVTTMTSSKGLEFDAVMIIGVDEESIPSYQALGNLAQMEEDRRKFYVSITRARDEVRIFYSGFVVKPWGDRTYAGPSRFLKEVQLIA
jgi:DNA helicase-2/ATP-dependent DNA helicase PcrA